MDLSRIKAVVMDMDGVLWRGDQPLPGLLEFFALLEARHIPYALATNNSRLSPSDYLEKLARMGIHDTQMEQIITSGTTTIAYVRRHYPAGTLIHVLGGAGLWSGLAEADYAVTGAFDPQVRAVAVGLDFDLTYQKLKYATLCLQNGAEFIASNNDTTFPSPEGLVPGAGSIVAALAAASGREPLVMGKPHAPMFEAALSVLGTSAADTLMIGDRLDTDIAGASKLGIKTALVLTGVSKREEIPNAPFAPDVVFEGLVDLAAAWGA